MTKSQKLEKGTENNIEFLWKSFLKGNDNGFVLIYQYFIESMLSYGLKLCPDKEQVQDSIQEVFMDLFLKRKKNSIEIRNLKSYLFVALRNSIVKKMAKKRKLLTLPEKESEEDNIFQIEYNHLDVMVESDLNEQIIKKLQAAINSLPSKQKEVIYLKFEEELDYQEISSIMKITIDSTRKLMFRAITSLREIIGPRTGFILFNIFSKKVTV